jgi:hypothetical protein
MCFADCVSYTSMEQSLSNYYTKLEIHQQLGNINSILESIIGKSEIVFMIRLDGSM